MLVDVGDGDVLFVVAGAWRLSAVGRGWSSDEEAHSGDEELRGH